MPEIQACPKCGEKIEANWEVCAYCGHVLRNHKSNLSSLKLVYWPLLIVLIGILVLLLNSLLKPRSSLLPPARTGKIAFVANVYGIWQVFVINPDGTEAQQLTDIAQPGAGDPAISPDGTTIAFVNARKIYTLGTDGRDLMVIYEGEFETGWPSWSPDSKKIIFASQHNGNLDIFTMNLDGTNLVQITEDLAKDQDPVFSPNGTQIAFSSNRSGAWEIHILNLTNGKTEQITRLGDNSGTGWPSWSPDGLSIAFESIGEANNRDIFTIKTDGTQLKNITNNPAYDGAPVWSPNGKQIAFISDRNNNLNVYIMQSDGTQLRRLSEHWAWGPSWSMTTPLQVIQTNETLETPTFPDATQTPPLGEIITITPHPRPMEFGRTMGDPNAPVTIEVYDDFQCPACKTYAEQIEPQVVDTYVSTGQVHYIYRHFPFLDDRAPQNESDQAANASMCASDENRFWDYYDILFANWHGENQGAFNDNRLVAFAESLGLDMPAFNRCFDSNTHKDEIDEDTSTGKSIGVTGTPSVFVNGRLLSPGFIPSFEEISQEVEMELANSGD